VTVALNAEGRSHGVSILQPPRQDFQPEHPFRKFRITKYYFSIRYANNIHKRSCQAIFDRGYQIESGKNGNWEIAS
jgi:hypothetical protein